MTTIDGIGRTNTSAVETNDYGLDTPSGPRAPSILRDGMRELMTSGDPGAALAALVVAMGRTERNSDQAMKNRAESLQENEEQAQLDEMEKNATTALASAVVSSAATAAGGAMTAAASVSSLRADRIDAKVKGVSDQDPSKTALLDQVSKLKTDATEFKGGADLTSATSKLTTGALDYVASEHDITATAHSHAASHAKSAVEDARNDVDGASKLIDKALEFYKEYKSTKDQTTQVASRRA